MGVRGCAVQLQSSSDGKTFKNTGTPYTTAKGGAFSFSVAPTAKTFYRVHFSGSGNYYLSATSAAIYLMPRVYLSAPSAPSTASHGRAFTSVTYLKPRHTVGSYPVKILCYRKERQLQRHLQVGAAQDRLGEGGQLLDLHQGDGEASPCPTRASGTCAPTTRRTQRTPRPTRATGT